MNVRKPTDYSALFAALDKLVAADLSQMELYCGIGRLVSGRPEKGAAVAAAEYLQSAYPDAAGFSPRNLRRMRDFYRTYESAPEVMAAATSIGWTQNIVILEAELTLQEKSWYIRAVQRFRWSKLKLVEQIASAAHLDIPLDLEPEVCYTEENNVTECMNDDKDPHYLHRQHLPQPNGRVRDGRTDGGMTMSHRIICYGDSNTYGYDPRSYLGERYPEAVRWTELLNAAGWKVINQGENGRSIPMMDYEIETAVKAVRDSKADILVVMLGSNDILQRPDFAAEGCGGRMERFLTAILAETQANLKILLAAPPPMEAGAWVSDPRTIETSRQLAGSYEVTAHRLGIAFVDAGSWGVGLSYDGVHFSEKGHLAFAKGMRKALDTLL